MPCHTLFWKLSFLLRKTNFLLSHFALRYLEISSKLIDHLSLILYVSYFWQSALCYALQLSQFHAYISLCIWVGGANDHGVFSQLIFYFVNYHRIFGSYHRLSQFILLDVVRSSFIDLFDVECDIFSLWSFCFLIVLFVRSYWNSSL